MNTKNSNPEQGQMTATFYNTFLNETYTLGGVRDLAHAWSLGLFACERMNWNTMDLTRIKVK